MGIREFGSSYLQRQWENMKEGFEPYFWFQRANTEQKSPQEGLKEYARVEFVLGVTFFQNLENLAW